MDVVRDGGLREFVRRRRRFVDDLTPRKLVFLHTRGAAASALRFDRLTVNRDQVHFVHAMPGRDGLDGVGFDHPDLGATRRAAVAHVDPAKFPVGRWCGNRRGERPNHSEADLQQNPRHEEGNRYPNNPTDHTERLTATVSSG